MRKRQVDAVIERDEALQIDLFIDGDRSNTTIRNVTLMAVTIAGSEPSTVMKQQQQKQMAYFCINIVLCSNNRLD